MATRVVSTPLTDSGIVTVAYNVAHTRLAAFDQDGQLSLWRRDGHTRTWLHSASWAAQGQRITVLCWAPSEFGSLVCSGSADGAVCVWGESADANEGWSLRARLVESSQPVLSLAFAPLELGPIVAAAYGDGFLRTFEASSLLDAPTWALHSEACVSAAAAGRACTSLSWRQHDPSLPPLLVLGTAGSGAQVWMFRQALLRWERVAQLGQADDDYQGSAVAGVAWAPTLGRPSELLAVAAGPRVVLWSLRGAADSPDTERVAVLHHASNVGQVDFNMFGNWLAASTDDGEVCMWRPDLTGEWLLLNKVGAAPADGEEEDESMRD